MSSANNVSPMDFTDSQLKEIEDLASIGRSLRSIARIMGYDYGQLKQAHDLPGSAVALHFALGVERASAKVDLATRMAAEGGNITAIQQFEKIQERQKYNERKRQILGLD